MYLAALDLNLSFATYLCSFYAFFVVVLWFSVSFAVGSSYLLKISIYLSVTRGLFWDECHLVWNVDRA